MVVRYIRIIVMSGLTELVLALADAAGTDAPLDTRPGAPERGDTGVVAVGAASVAVGVESVEDAASTPPLAVV